ncbi:hypothetical protein ScPMuIL_003771 [Solemya velum]
MQKSVTVFVLILLLDVYQTSSRSLEHDVASIEPYILPDCADNLELVAINDCSALKRCSIKFLELLAGCNNNTDSPVCKLLDKLNCITTSRPFTDILYRSITVRNADEEENPGCKHDPTRVDDATATVVDDSVGGTAIYTCDDSNASMIGDDTIVCLENRTWSEPDLECSVDFEDITCTSREGQVMECPLTSGDQATVVILLSQTSAQSCTKDDSYAINASGNLEVSKSCAVLVSGKHYTVSGLRRFDRNVGAIPVPWMKNARAFQLSDNCKGFCCFLKKTLQCPFEGEGYKKNVCAIMEKIPGCRGFSSSDEFSRDNMTSDEWIRTARGSRNSSSTMNGNPNEMDERNIDTDGNQNVDSNVTVLNHMSFTTDTCPRGVGFQDSHDEELAQNPLDPALEEACSLYNRLMAGELTLKYVSDREFFKDIHTKIAALKSSLVNKRTAKLWLFYLDMVHLLQKFIEAERTGNWRMHLHTTQMMLPYLAAVGHNLYVKLGYVYLCEMQELEQCHPDVYAMFEADDDCRDDPPNVIGTRVTVVDSDTGGTAVYTCDDPSAVILGDDTIVCSADRTWSEPSVVCTDDFEDLICNSLEGTVMECIPNKVEPIIELVLIRANTHDCIKGVTFKINSDNRVEVSGGCQGLFRVFF